MKSLRARTSSVRSDANGHTYAERCRFTPEEVAHLRLVGAARKVKDTVPLCVLVAELALEAADLDADVVERLDAARQAVGGVSRSAYLRTVLP